MTKNYSGKIILFLSLIVLSACSPKITADYNKETPFTEYKSFNFTRWHPDNAKMVDKVEKERIYRVITEELEARGLSKVDYNADIVINITTIVNKDKHYHAAYNMYRPAYYSYYFGYGYSDGESYSYGNYYSPISVSVYDTYYGGLVIDAFDLKTKKQVWQGSALGKISNSEKQRSIRTPKAIRNMFKKFPIEIVK